MDRAPASEAGYASSILAESTANFGGRSWGSQFNSEWPHNIDLKNLLFYLPEKMVKAIKSKEKGTYIDLILYAGFCPSDGLENSFTAGELTPGGKEAALEKS